MTALHSFLITIMGTSRSELESSLNSEVYSDKVYVLIGLYFLTTCFRVSQKFLYRSCVILFILFFIEIYLTNTIV